MREILFRAKRIISGEWVFGGIMMTFHPNFPHKSEVDFWEGKGNCYCICTNNSDIFVEQETIGQYTGVKDKNGVRVFEGDIVRTQFGRFVRIEYRTLEGFVGFDMTAIESEHERPWSSTAWRSGNIEVVGNIHDGSELLR